MVQAEKSDRAKLERQREIADWLRKQPAAGVAAGGAEVAANGLQGRTSTKPATYSRSYSSLLADEAGVPIDIIREVLATEGRDGAAMPRVLSEAQRIWNWQPDTNTQVAASKADSHFTIAALEHANRVRAHALAAASLERAERAQALALVEDPHARADDPLHGERLFRAQIAASRLAARRAPELDSAEIDSIQLGSYHLGLRMCLLVVAR